MQLNKAIKKRHSVKKFKDKKPNWRHVIEAIDSARYAPMAGNIFTPRFIIVQDYKKIKKIALATGQPFVSNTYMLVVMCSNPSKTINAYKKKGEIYTRQQAGATIQNFLLSLEEKKLSTTWVSHFVEDQIKNELKIPKEINVEAVFPIGYEFKKPTKKKIKIEMDRILFFEKYKNKRMSEPNKAGLDSSRPWI